MLRSRKTKKTSAEKPVKKVEKKEVKKVEAEAEKPKAGRTIYKVYRSGHAPMAFYNKRQAEEFAGKTGKIEKKVV